MSVYVAYINKIAPKVLTQVDRDKHSKTYGCCDRNFWHLKVRDFSSAILQQTGLALLLLYQLDYGFNPFYQKEQVLEWAQSTVYFWKSIQLKDGSFNEYYPNEHGFPPTAFSLYSACEIYKRTNMNDETLITAMKRTGRYLVSHIEKQAYNQELASITALYSLYTICKEAWVKDGLEKKLSRIIELQSPEGWFFEYGGADIGYLSVSLDMLAEYYWMSKDERVVKALNRIVSFIKYFVHPDGTIGGEYGSRNTTYFLPNGLEVLIQLGNFDAIAIKNFIYKNADQNYFFLDAVDDRYCSHYLLHSFLRALQKEQECGQKNTDVLLPCQLDGRKYFADAGLLVYKKEEVFLIVGLKKGGVLKVYVNGKEIYIDCGYRVNYGDGKVSAMNWQDTAYKVKVEGYQLDVSGYFNSVSLKVPSPILHLGLRVVAKTIGNRIIGTLKKKIILVDKHSKIYFHRNILIGDNNVSIIDEVKSPIPVKLENADNFSLRHVASGKFFTVSDLTKRSSASYENIKDICIIKEIDLKTGSVLEYRKSDEQ